MTHPIAGFVAVSALLGALGGCAAPITADHGSGLAAGRAKPQPEPGWFLLGQTEGASLYIHPRSTLRVGSSAFIMVVAARHQPTVLPGGVSVGSLRERYEIDCSGWRYRRHDGTAHPDRAALGPVLGRVGPDQWRAVNPDTVIAALSSAVCSDTAEDTEPAPPGPMAPPPRRGRSTFRT